MLLRRLGLALKSHWAPRGTDGDTHTHDEWERPLGRIAPVGTSATLGDKGDPAAMLAFAETIFGETLGPDAVVTESRLSLEEWAYVEPPDGITAVAPTTTVEQLGDGQVAKLDADGRQGFHHSWNVGNQVRWISGMSRDMDRLVDVGDPRVIASMGGPDVCRRLGDRWGSRLNRVSQPQDLPSRSALEADRV